MHYDPPDLTGAVLSQKYKLRKRVGWGGMGTVYATDSFEDGRRLAVKILNEGEAAEVEVVRRFIEEGKLSQRLQHPNIVRVYGVEVAEDGCPYLVMEFLAGVPLAAYTAQGGRVPLAQSIMILKGMLAGLAHAHAQGVVHRDLKPDNVYLALDKDKQYEVKILDFGIAKVMDLAGGMGKRTRTGVLLGTPAYMSPEQIRSSKDVDARSDLFSVGVLAFEMLTGRPAFPAPTEYAKLAAVLNSEPPPLDSIDPSLERLTEFVRRALQKDRNLRHQSATEMGQALAHAMGERLTTSAIPLSRLPEMPAHLGSVAPASLTPTGDAAGNFSTVALSVVAPAASPTPSTQRTMELPQINPGPYVPHVPKGGSLVSPPPNIPSPRFVVVHRPTGTLPSHDLPMLEPPGTKPVAPAGKLPPWLWIVLGGVVLLLVGIGLGLLVAALQR